MAEKIDGIITQIGQGLLSMENILMVKIRGPENVVDIIEIQKGIMCG